MMKATLLACCVCGALSAQVGVHETGPHWEAGAFGGFGWTNDLTVKTSNGSATTGLKTGGAVGVFGADDMYDRLSGEARYTYRFSDLKLSSGGTSTSFGGHTHIAEAGFLYHFTGRQSRMRPFFAFGGGIKVLQGTGRESAAQPLGRFAALTATREVLPTADVGFGVKWNIRPHLRFRVEVRDYISPAPERVIAAAPSATISGILNDVTGMGALSFFW